MPVPVCCAAKGSGRLRLPIGPRRSRSILTTPVCCAIGAIACWPAWADGAQYVVRHGGGGTHTTIQSAINDAVDGDDVLVMEGVYFERLQFRGADITVHSLDPLDADVVDSTVIDGALGDTDPTVDAVRHRFA